MKECSFLKKSDTADSTETLLIDAFGLSKKLGRVPFPLAVKVSSGYHVIPIDLTKKHDKELVNKLQLALTKFLETIRSSQPVYKGKRINDVGRKIESQIVHELNKLPLTVRQLGKTGYPDIEILFEEQIAYLEMKTSSVTNRSRLRYFYYTGGNKIQSNAHHLLLTIFATPDNPGYWKVENLMLSDLHTLDVQLKTEFNASKDDLIDKSTSLIVIK